MRLRKRLKAQHEIMEYVILTLFIVIIIIGFVFFLSGWNITQLQLDKEKARQDRALFIMKYFLSSPLFTKENSVFDDTKLDAFRSLPNECTELGKIIGENWFAEIETFNGAKWEMCTQNKNYSAYIVPANVYRKFTDKAELGTLKVGVYG